MNFFSALRSLALSASRHLRWLLPLVAVLLTASAEWLAPPGSAYLAEEWLRDRYIRLQATSAEEPRVLIVDVDEASLAAIGPWPWPRSRLADLVEILIADYQRAASITDCP